MAQQEWEVGALTKIPEVDKKAGELCAQSPAKAVAAWWDLGDKLLVKYNHFGFYDPEKRSRGRGQAPSEVWQKAVRMADIWTDR
jgi:hypothetical protein